MVSESLSSVDLARLQFALTALYHFIFVPLTLGLSMMMGIMETVYVMTKRSIWLEMTKFWGILFGINFAMGVATGLTMEFQFGTNWAYYSHYVGDVFGVPLAIEGLMAFFLEATFVGLFFFGWNKISNLQHLIVTWLVALGSSLSALWILIANGWMQHPVGSYFNFETMRMEVKSFAEVMLNPVAQAKFVHTISAGYVTGAIFVLAISSYYLLRGRNIEFAKRSFAVAAAFGLASALSVVVLGDESGYVDGQNQKMKLAAIEAMWETEPAPAGFTLFGIPDLQAHKTNYEIKVPFMLGLIATRSFDEEILGIDQLVGIAKNRIESGIQAYSSLEILKKNPDDQAARAQFDEHSQDLGYALLLKPFVSDVVSATQEQIQQAADSTIPNVPVLFWSFRVMVGIGFFMILLFAAAFYLSSLKRETKPWFLRIALWSLPLPWISCELGWVVAEHGRQPWAIDGVLPTHLGASALPASHVWISLTGFTVFYTALAIVEVYLMIKYIRSGPDNFMHRNAIEGV
ncbi:MAG: cytochrome ubiquinol oxidase subunit I [Gammaproteobacteria bacterium]|nr:cytochrome ubiquinol oxidase subunit I [Gammaproteobacteria bacterium]